MKSLVENGFTNFPNLQVILLTFNEITDIDVNAFNNLTELTTLFLGHNEITELPDGVFDGLIRLQKLDLENNPVANYTTRYLIVAHFKTKLIIFFQIWLKIS